MLHLWMVTADSSFGWASLWGLGDEWHVVSLHKVVLIEHVVQEYFPVGIEATLCSFSAINYGQAVHPDVRNHRSGRLRFLERVPRHTTLLEMNPLWCHKGRWYFTHWSHSQWQVCLCQMETLHSRLFVLLQNNVGVLFGENLQMNVCGVERVFFWQTFLES